MKRSYKAEDVLKGDCNAFGTIITKTLILKEAVQYAISSV